MSLSNDNNFMAFKCCTVHHINQHVDHTQILLKPSSLVKYYFKIWDSVPFVRIKIIISNFQNFFFEGSCKSVPLKEYVALVCP